MNQIIRDIYQQHHHTYPLKENIRFELAHGRETDYDQKIENGKKRAHRLFEEVFHDSENIQMIFFDAACSKKGFFRKFLHRNYFTIIDHFMTDSFKEYYTDETSITVVETPLVNVRKTKLIDGICYEDFKKPGKLRITNDVVFYETKKHTLLTIYDDRGCDIWSDNIQQQQAIYHKFNDWILDYDRGTIDQVFKELI